MLPFADEEAVVQTRFATAVLALWQTWLGLASRGRGRGTPGRGRGRGHDAVDPTAFDHFVFLGAGAAVGLANEAALKMQESAGAWSECLPGDGVPARSGERRRRLDPRLAARSRSIASVLEAAPATGATVVDAHPEPMVTLVAIQRAAVKVALSRGRDPNFPRYLTRSVVLN